MSHVKKICVIDDDDTYSFLIKAQIRKKFPEMEWLNFEDGNDAIAYLTNNNYLDELPDIILLDINMKLMDGWEFLEEFIELKKLFSKNILIYVVSSSINPHDVEKAKSYSDVSDYIVKPIPEEQLIEILSANV